MQKQLPSHPVRHPLPPAYTPCCFAHTVLEAARISPTHTRSSSLPGARIPRASSIQLFVDILVVVAYTHARTHAREGRVGGRKDEDELSLFLSLSSSQLGYGKEASETVSRSHEWPRNVNEAPVTQFEQGSARSL